MTSAVLEPDDERRLDWQGGILLVALFATLLAARHAAQSFWLDELWMVRWLRDGAPPDTPVPPLFVLLARSSGALFGFGERGLRLPALLGYGALLLLPALLLRREDALVGKRFALYWSALLALSSPVAFYASQLKQYTGEAAIGAALLVAYLALDRNPGALGPRRLLALVALLAPLVAVPALLVVGPVLVAAWIRLRSLDSALSERQSGQRLLVASAVGAVTLFALIASRASTFVAGLANQRLETYWAARYWDGSAQFVFDATRHWLGHALNLTRGGLAILTLLTLLWLALGRGERTRRMLFLFVCAAPPFLALAASRIGRYPYGEVRLMLFAVPGALALLAAGFEMLASRAQRLGALLVASFLVYFAVQGVVRETYNSTYLRYDDASEVNAAVASLWRPGTAVVADPTFVAQLAFYAPVMAPDLVSSEPGATRLPLIRRRSIEVTHLPTAVSAADPAISTLRWGAFELTIRETDESWAPAVEPPR